jgi:hypothetical protein
MSKEIIKDCQFCLSCECKLNKVDRCEKCRWYKFIDSGYGFCRALPTFTIVAWCKDTCNFYKVRE